MAIPRFIGQGNGVQGTGNLSVDYPASISAGDLIILQIVCRDTTNTATATNGFAILYGPDTATGVGRQFLFYKIADGTETGSITVNVAGTVSHGARMYLFRGTRTTGFNEGGATQSGTGASIEHPNVTTSASERLIVAFTYVTDDNALPVFVNATGGTWTEGPEYLISAGTDGEIQLQYASVTGTTTLASGTATMAAADPWVVRAFALTPLGAQTYDNTGSFGAQAFFSAGGALTIEDAASFVVTENISVAGSLLQSDTADLPARASLTIEVTTIGARGGDAAWLPSIGLLMPIVVNIDLPVRAELLIAASLIQEGFAPLTTKAALDISATLQAVIGAYGGEAAWLPSVGLLYQQEIGAFGGEAAWLPSVGLLYLSATSGVSYSDVASFNINAGFDASAIVGTIGAYGGEAAWLPSIGLLYLSASGSFAYFTALGQLTTEAVVTKQEAASFNPPVDICITVTATMNPVVPTVAQATVIAAGTLVAPVAAQFQAQAILAAIGTVETFSAYASVDFLTRAAFEATGQIIAPVSITLDTRASMDITASVTQVNFTTMLSMGVATIGTFEPASEFVAGAGMLAEATLGMEMRGRPIREYQTDLRRRRPGQHIYGPDWQRIAEASAAARVQAVTKPNTLLASLAGTLPVVKPDSLTTVQTVPKSKAAKVSVPSKEQVAILDAEADDEEALLYILMLAA